MKILEIDIFLLPHGASRRADEATAKSGAGPGLFCLKLSRPEFPFPPAARQTRSRLSDRKLCGILKKIIIMRELRAGR
jgi:hypothetical protein